MEAIETLKEEHRLIERVLDAFEEYGGKVGRNEVDDSGELQRFVTFFREFADRCHHGKEKRILFEALVASGFRRDAGPIAIMLAEHEQGRALTLQLAALAGRGTDWTPVERKLVSVTSAEYVKLLRNHIRKEDGVLFPMAAAHLDAEAARSVSRAFHHFEEVETGQGVHERLHDLAQELAGRHRECEHYHSSTGCEEGFGLRM